MPFIPENIIDEILGRVDIIELVSSYIPLKRIGRSYKALCPFHHEKTPSFIVSPERQIFHCFGCGAGGNAIGFLMQYERLDFPEAVEILAKKTNVVIPKSSGYNDSGNQGTSLQLYKINELAANFYVSRLWAQEGAGALSYLAKRDISKETITRFKIGYAADNWEGILNYLRTKNIPLSLIEKAGLIIPREGNTGYYDRFRKRIIVPIIDIKDRIVAFGARVLDDSLPKYINSPETAIYSKSKNLFGLNSAKDGIRHQDEVIIVEGYFDLIMLHQAGITNVVASCGTALTEEQIRLLKRHTKNVIMIFDSDNAGQMATVRSLDLLIEEELSVKVAYLPPGYDPDSFVRKAGADKFRQFVKEAKDVFDYKFRVLKSKYNFETITDKARIVSEMLPTINRFSNEVIKSACIRRLSEELKVDEGSLWAELRKIKDTPIHYKQETAAEKQIQAPSFSTERMIVKLILEEQELIEQLKGMISPLDFQNLHFSKIVARLFDLFSEGKIIKPNLLIDYFSDQQITRIICELTAGEGPKMADKDKILNDCVKRLQGGRLKLRQQEVSEQIKQAEIEKDDNKLKELLKEFQSLTKKGVN